MPAPLTAEDRPFARRIYPEPLPRDDAPTDRHVDREIVRLVLARIPLIAVITYEELRVLGQLIRPIRKELIDVQTEQLRQRLGRSEGAERAALEARLERLPAMHPVVRWSATHGLEYCEPAVDDEKQEYYVPRPLHLPDGREPTNPVAVLLHLGNPANPLVDRDGRPFDASSALFAFCDLHPWLDRHDPAGKFNHTAVRALRDLVQATKHSPWPRGVVLLSPQPAVPHELKDDLKVQDYPLPTPEQLAARLDSKKAQWRKIHGPDCIALGPEEKKDLVRGLSGLTYEEAGNVLLKALSSDGRLGPEHVGEAFREKQQIIKKDGTLDYFVSNVDFTGVGGLDLLRRWLEDRRPAFLGKTLEFELDGKPYAVPLPAPKGILLIGVPGGGKSLVAKAVGQAWGLPLLRLDVGRIFASRVGESERNMHNAIRVAESVAPAVVWLDEIEKAFPKTSASTDSGVSVRVMSIFLTWMQERKKSVFVVATGNDVSQLPPELSRKGRFDEIFYVGLPNLEARVRIFAIHTRGLPLDDSHHRRLAERAKWYTGAEIEQVMHNSLFRLEHYLGPRRAEGPRDASDHPVVQAVLDCMAHFIPLAMRQGEDGRGFVEKMLETASLIAAPASTHFEQPPSDHDAKRRFVPEKIDTDGYVTSF